MIGHRYVFAALLLLVVPALLGTLAVGGHAATTSIGVTPTIVIPLPTEEPQGPGAPPVLTFPTLHVQAHGRWVRSSVVHLNQPARFALSVRVVCCDRVRRAYLQFFRFHFTEPGHLINFGDHHIYQVGMARIRRWGGRNYFSVIVVFRSRSMLRRLSARFNLLTVHSLIEPAFFITVK